MLQLVLGKAGTGKTTSILDNIEKIVKEDQRAVLIVPEQISFETERTLLYRLGTASMKNVEVLSFTRLSQDIFRVCGGLAGQRLDQTGRYLLMNLALGEVSDTLEVYRRQSKQNTFISTLVEVITEFKLAGAYPEDLIRVARSTDDTRFAQKLSELSSIYTAYQALLERSYTDPHDDITRAGRLAAQCGYFNDMHIFVDGFMYFSAAERNLLSIAIEQANEVWVSLCCDALAEQERDTGIFSSSRRTAKRLISRARHVSVKVAPPIVLNTPYRFQSEGLLRIENLMSANIPLQQGVDEGVTLICADNPYEEAKLAAYTVSRLVREGFRYNEIVVIARDITKYQAEIESAFGRYGIPFHTQDTVVAELHPLITALLSALEAATVGTSTEVMLNMAKNPALGFTEEEASKLENYSFIWSFGAKDWKNSFTKNPFGSSPCTEEVKQKELQGLEQLRKKLVGPVLALSKGIRNCDGRGFAEACYFYLEEIGAAENLRRFATKLEPIDKKSFLEQTSSLWQQLMNCLDLFAKALEHKITPPQRLYELMRLSAASIDLDQIPRTVDQVVCGSATHMLAGGPRAAIVLGMNEGVFPAAITSGGIFTDMEISGLFEEGVEISQPAYERALGERFYLYTALTSSSQRLVATCSLSSNSGSPLQPALPFKRLMAAMPGAVLSSSDIDPVELLNNEDTALSLLASSSREDSILRSTLEEYFRQSGRPETSERLAGAAVGCTHKPIKPETASRLFGDTLYLSPSKLERYFSCPFEYFCQDGLRIAPRRRMEFSPLESGAVIHLVLERIVQMYGGAPLVTLAQDELEEQIAKIIGEYLADYAGDESELPARQRYLFKRLVGLLVRIIRRLGAEFLQSEFVPVGFEVEVSGKAEIKPLELDSDICKIYLQGKIDRLDMYDDGEKRYIRVVDYKSGGRKLSLAEVYEGLNIQMLIYLFSVCEGNSGRFSGSLPAGVLYMPAKAEAVNLPRNTAEEQAVAEVEKGMKHNGLLLSDAQVLQAMEKGLGGRYIPVKMTKSGIDSRSLTASLSQLEDIKMHIKKLISSMVEDIYMGRITPNPAVSGSKSPCQYCSYSKICLNADGGICRSIQDISADEFFTAIKGGEGSGGKLD